MPRPRKSSAPSTRTGSLTVVGTGIQLIAHVTHEARAELEAAEELLFVASDPAVSAWLERLNPNARSLGTLYRPGRNRHEIYDAMVEEILAPVRRGARVCAAFYGHPGVFVSPSHEAVRIARDEGYPARMLAAVSAEDCLFADLGINPGERGCQSYEATEFLVHRHVVDPTAALLLWQVDLIGQVDFRPEPGVEGLRVLVDYLLGSYPAEHEVVLYTASPYPLFGPTIARVPLGRLPEVELVPMPTLYVPPLAARPLDPEMLSRLGMERVTSP